MELTMIPTDAEPTSDHVWGLDPIQDLPDGSVVIDITGQAYEIKREFNG